MLSGVKWAVRNKRVFDIKGISHCFLNRWDITQYADVCYCAEFEVKDGYGRCLICPALPSLRPMKIKNLAPHVLTANHKRYQELRKEESAKARTSKASTSKAGGSNDHGSPASSASSTKPDAPSTDLAAHHDESPADQSKSQTESPQCTDLNLTIEDFHDNGDLEVPMPDPLLDHCDPAAINTRPGA